jgi:hypothetical protein
MMHPTETIDSNNWERTLLKSKIDATYTKSITEVLSQALTEVISVPEKVMTTEFYKKHSENHPFDKIGCKICRDRAKNYGKENKTELSFISPNKWIVIVLGSKDSLTQNDW